MSKIKRQVISILFIATAAILFSCAFAPAAETPRQSAEILLNTYHINRARLETNNFGIPLVVDSSERDDRVHVDVYGIFDHPFGNVVNVLKLPSNWCDIVALFPNVKACTSRDLPGAGLLTLYLGRKTYQAPEDARQIIFNFHNVVQQQGYADFILTANEGPFGTKDHRIRVEALPLDGARTFIHVSYAYSDSVALRLASKIYFATFGRSKVGFTVTGTDEDNNPVHIGGPRGAVERNAVRCYLAIQAVMISMHSPEQNRFKTRTNQWYDLSTRYRKQLFDLDKQEYLTIKRREQKSRQLLQQRVGTGIK